MNRNTFWARAFGPFLRLFDLHGRTARRDFWPYMLLLFLSWLVCGVAVLTAYGAGPSVIFFVMTAPSGWLIAADLFFLPFMLLGFAAVARRLHDIGMNALPVVAYVLLYGASVVSSHLLATPFPRIAGSNAQREAELMTGVLLGLPGLLVPLCFVALIIICSQAGTRGPNPYGPDPRQAQASDLASDRTAKSLSPDM